MTKIAVSGGRVIDPANQIDENLEVAIVDGEIISLQPTLEDFTPDFTIDANTKIICPGLVDINAQIVLGSSTTTVNQQLNEALRAGITEVAALAIRDQESLNLTEIQYYLESNANSSDTATLHLIGPLTQNLQGAILTELKLLSNVGCLAFSNGNRAIINTLIKRRCYDYAAMMGLKLFIQPEDHYLSGAGMMHEGEVSIRLGIPGIPSLAETLALSQELLLLQSTRLLAHIRNVSVGKSISMLEVAKERSPVTADVALPNLFLTDVDVRLDSGFFYVNPPLRGNSDLQALRDGIKRGVISAIASNHISLPTLVKELPFQDSQPGMATWPVLLPLVLRLVEEADIPLMTALSTITSGPAKILGIDAGHLSIGKQANMIIFDPNVEWCLNTQQKELYGESYPFQYWHLKGQLEHVFSNGNWLKI